MTLLDAKASESRLAFSIHICLLSFSVKDGIHVFGKSHTSSRWYPSVWKIPYLSVELFSSRWYPYVRKIPYVLHPISDLSVELFSLRWCPCVWKIPYLSVEVFSSRWYPCVWKIPYVLHPFSEKIPHYCI